MLGTEEASQVGSLNNYTRGKLSGHHVLNCMVLVTLTGRYVTQFV